MNILILKFPYHSAMGGGEIHTLQLFSELSKRGHKFYLASSCRILLKEFKKRNWPSEKIFLGPEPVSIWGIFCFTVLAPFIFWRLFFLLLKYRIKYKTNKLYCLSLTEKLLAAAPAKLCGYSIFWMEHLRIERWLLKNPYKIFYILYSRLATVITVSNAVQEQLNGLGLQADGIKVIYNGIDIDKFKPSGEIKGEGHKIVVGTVCRLCPEKGVDFLIRAFKKALNANVDLRLKIAGQGPQRESLISLADELGIRDKVEFLGWQDNISEFLNSLHIFALTPIRRESFGIAAAEALACAKPVVATNISGLKEVVKDQKTGIIVEAGDIGQIAAAIVRLANNEQLRMEMGKRGRIRVRENFTIDKMINNFEAIFENN